MPGPFGQDERFCNGLIQTEQHGIDGQFHRCAGSGWPDPNDLSGQRVEHRERSIDGLVVSCCHHEQCLACRRGDAA